METIDITELTIFEVNNKIKKLDNQLNYYIDKKEKEYNKTQPKATDLSIEKIQGGGRENRFDLYVIKNEELDPFIDEIQDEIYRLTRYVEKELQRINEYEPLLKKIIYLREQDKKKWFEISMAINYSESQCRRIYKKYKNKRDI